jgi:chromosome segregation ATPase
MIEPNDITNEMHSVFGTESSKLPKALTNYYNRYFNNRSAVVGFASKYKNEFTNRISKIDSYDKQLSVLKAQITAEEQNLNSQLNQLNTDRARLDSLKASGQFEAYNAQIPAFNSEVATYNQGVENLQSDITRYNSLIDARNSVANDLRSLDKSIDTRLTTQSAQ